MATSFWKASWKLLSLGGYCCWVRFALTVLFSHHWKKKKKKKKEKAHSISSMRVVFVREINVINNLMETYGKITQSTQLCFRMCLFFSTWFPKCNIFQCFRNQTDQGHCSYVKPCPIFHKIRESCIKFSQCTHSFNEKPAVFPHTLIAWELSSAFC